MARNTAQKSAVDTDEPVLTQRQVSERYNVPRGTLKRWRHYNLGPLSFLRGGKVVYPESGLAKHFGDERARSERGGTR